MEGTGRPAGGRRATDGERIKRAERLAVTWFERQLRDNFDPPPDVESAEWEIEEERRHRLPQSIARGALLLLQAHLDLRAQATTTAPVVGADGVARTHARHGTRPLETLLGTVAVTRPGHGARGHETLFPVTPASPRSSLPRGSFAPAAPTSR